MALIACEECRGSISDRATACPHCGLPIVYQLLSQLPNQPLIPATSENVEAVKPASEGKFVIGLAAVIIVGFVLFSATHKNAQQANPAKPTSAASSAS